MAKPNYSFEKRQRELAKKKKKEQKEKDKADRKVTPGSDGDGTAPGDAGAPQAAPGEPATGG